MPLSIPNGLSREVVLRAIFDLDAGFEHPFGPPTGSELVHEGKQYAPKAVIGWSTAMGQGIDRLPGYETPVGSAARISFRT